VDILFTVCMSLFVCTVTDFFTKDKASGVKFCMAVYQCPGRGMVHFGEVCSPRNPKLDVSNSVFISE